jgi:hypothetical protein
MNSQATPNARQTEMFNLIEAYRQSGQRQNQFCTGKKLRKSTFLYWLKKYRKDQTQVSGFMALNLSHPNYGGDYRIELPNGVRIHLCGPEGIKLIADIISKTRGSHAAHN